MSRMSRRALLWRGIAAAGLGVCGFPAGSLAQLARSRSAGYGPLHPAATENTGEILLALPEGFRYTVLGRAGDLMSDGHPTPASHDGMAAFYSGGRIRLLRNHEIFDLQPRPLGPLQHSYDSRGGGGTTTLVVDPVRREVVRDFLSLSGTSGNCSGGPTPWGSWISCEETVDGPLDGFERKHGYCFEIPSSADELVAALPIREMGRFEHEAIAVDPATGIVYLTEDNPTAGFYRFVPEVSGDLRAGGTLQMLAIENAFRFDARGPQTRGKALPAAWVDIDDPDPADAEQTRNAVYRQGLARGGATFTRLEGITYLDGSIYFDSTDGGAHGLGQLWRYRIRPASAGRRRAVSRPGKPDPEPLLDAGADALSLAYESASESIMSGPDNLCVSPRSEIIICEDGPGESQSILGFTSEGMIFEIARNIMEGFTSSELTGVTFSPDGNTLFANIQTPGLTLAIWGPWGDER